MKRNSLIGYIILMALFLVWMQYRQGQLEQVRQTQMEQARQDSIAAAQRAPEIIPPTPGAPEPRARGTGPVMGAPSDTPVPEALEDADAPAASHRLMTVETPKFTVRLDNLGAKISSILLKDMDGKRPHNPELIPQNRDGALTVALDRYDLSNVVWELDNQEDYLQVSGNRPLVVKFSYRIPELGRTVERTYTFQADSGKIRHEMSAPGFSSAFALNWNAGLNETEEVLKGKGFGLMSSYFSELVFDTGASVFREVIDGQKTFNAQSGVLHWVGLRRKYVAAVINFGQETTHKVEAATIVEPGISADVPRTYQVRILGAHYEDRALDFDFEILPLSYTKLLNHHQNYEKIIFSGWEWLLRADVWYVALCGLVLKLLNWFYAMIPNYGIAIILLTLLVRVITLPLTISQTKSAAKMQQHAPAISKIREKHKGQPQKMQQEIMAYYQKAGVNPLAGMMGCFPLFLQMPIFIALFNVLGRAVELKDAHFFGWINDLSYPDVILSGVQIPYIFPLGLTVLPFFMAGTMYVQMKLTIKDPNQKFMVWMMPAMMFVFSCSFPSGLVLYWTVSNVFTIAQTYFYTSKLMPVSTTPPAAKIVKRQ